MARRATAYGETQFSIYKINNAAVKSHFVLEKNPKDSEYADCVVKKPIANIVQSLYTKQRNVLYNTRLPTTIKNNPQPIRGFRIKLGAILCFSTQFHPVAYLESSWNKLHQSAVRSPVP